MASGFKTPPPGDVKKSSPIKPYRAPINESQRDEWSTNVYPSVNSEISFDKMFDILVPSDRHGWVEQMSTEFKETLPRDKNGFIAYLNELSQHVREKIKSEKEQEPKSALDYTLIFQSGEKITPAGHPAGSRCRPDIVALRRSDDETDLTDDETDPIDDGTVKKFCWGHLEATGEVDSGRGEPKGCAQAAAYAAFNLQARPDLKMSLGIYVKDKECRLFAVSACVVYITDNINLKNIGERLPVLCGWMWRIYVADKDDSLAIDYKLSSTPPTFTLKQDGKSISGLSVIYAGETIGRRTIVLQGKESSQDIIVKEQYMEYDRRFKENKLLKDIHAKCPFPGIVGLAQESGATTVLVTGQLKDGTTVTRKKVRLLLNKSGVRLLGIQTLRQVLMAIYDALEVSRILFKEYKIFHRDYSKNNILLLEGDEKYKGSPGPELKDMCFSRFLLDQKDDQADPDSLARLTTRLLLIDFDSGEDIAEKVRSNGQPMPRTGTPVFMARRVRGPLELKGWYNLPPMPKLEEQIAKNYAAMHPERVETFPPDPERLMTFPVSGKVESIYISEFKTLDYHEHHLRYEAESLFWNLLFWCMTAQPAVAQKAEDYSNQIAKGFQVEVPTGTWHAFVGRQDQRNNNFISVASLSRSILHPGYAPLYSLLDDMRSHLAGDVEVFKDPLKKRPDYLHEVFQRLILNFLANNLGEPFMDIERSNKARDIEEGGYKGKSTTTRLSKGMTPDKPSSGQSAGSKRPAEVSGNADEQPKQPPTKKRKGPTSSEL